MRERNHTYLYTVRLTDKCIACNHDHRGKCKDCECPTPTDRIEQVEAWAGLDQVAVKLGIPLNRVIYLDKKIVQ